jgi:anti-anti-sigma factor
MPMVDHAEEADRAVVNVRVDRDDAGVTIRLTGELDLCDAPKLESRAAEVLERQAADVIVDARELNFCDAAGLSALLQIDKRVRASGHQMRIIDPPHCLQRLLSLLDMEGSFG